MSDIRTSSFWTNLLQKIVQIILKSLGGRTRKPTHNQHVVPHEEGWAVKGAGNERYTGVYDSQREALGRAKEIARNYGSTVIIHGEDGKVRDSISYRKR